MSYHDSYRPGRHDLVSVEVLSSTPTKRTPRVNWFVRVTYTGNPVSEFRGSKSETTSYASEAEARAAAAAIEAGS